MNATAIFLNAKGFIFYADQAEKCLLESNVAGEKPEDAEKFRKVTKAFFHDCRALRQFYDWCKEEIKEDEENKNNYDNLITKKGE